MSTATAPAPAAPQAVTGVPGLPPGPSAPRAVQTLAWTLRTGPFLDRNRARFGDQFTIKIGDEPPWVVLSDPEAVKQVFTGDPRLLHAGEGNVILKPILGEHSVLLLDEKPHLRQRRLLLPPLHGERMQQYGELMRQVAEEEVARWPRGEPLVLQPRMQAVTLEVIMRAVFGLREGERLERLRDRAAPAPGPHDERRARSCVINLIGPGKMMRVNSAIAPCSTTVDRADHRGDPRAPRRGATWPSATTSSRCCCRRGTRTAADERPRAARRAHDPARRRPRDQRDHAVLGARAAGPPPRRSSSGCAEARGGDEYADAVLKETLRLRPVLPIVARRVKAPIEIGGAAHPRRGDAGALHLPRAPAPRRLPRAAALRARALPGRHGGDVHVVPVRRRRAPLPGRVLRDVRDDDRAAGHDASG